METAPTIGEPRFAQFKSYRASTGCPLTSIAILARASARWRMRKEPARPSRQFAPRNTDPFAAATARLTATPVKRRARVPPSTTRANAFNRSHKPVVESWESRARPGRCVRMIRVTTVIPPTVARIVRESARASKATGLCLPGTFAVMLAGLCRRTPQSPLKYRLALPANIKPGYVRHTRLFSFPRCS